MAGHFPRICIGNSTQRRHQICLRHNCFGVSRQRVLLFARIALLDPCLLVQCVSSSYEKPVTNVRAACALGGNDEETLCNIARWFLKEYQFVTDGYSLFSALNRLCDSENLWYNCGASQKYILRQIKAVDFSLLGDPPRKNLFQERAAYSTKDTDGILVRAKAMDVALLMLYGHILYAGKSYASAVSKCC